MDVLLLRIPKHDADDDLDVDPNDVLKISNVDPDPDVANVLVDAIGFGAVVEVIDDVAFAA